MHASILHHGTADWGDDAGSWQSSVAARTGGQAAQKERFVQWWSDLSEVPGDLGPTVVAIGVFDGVHMGHRVIISRAVEAARQAGVPACCSPSSRTRPRWSGPRLRRCG